MLMLTDAELQDILYRIDNDMDNWRDHVRLREYVNEQAATIYEQRQHITEQAATIAQLRAEVDALKRETQAPDGWHKLFVATPTLPVGISVNGVPVPLNGNADDLDEVGA